MPTLDTEPSLLRQTVASVRAQTYPDWELCIADDGSGRQATHRVLKRAGGGDSRIRVDRLDRRSGISAATNRALSACRGELVAFIDHDDTLEPDALLKVALAFGRGEVDVAYTDQDKLTPRGARTDPFLKPDWSPVYALGAMYVGHLLVARRDLVAEAGGLDPKLDGIQDFDLLLRMSEHTQRIAHIPRVLYHWRAVPGSIAADASAKQRIPELQQRAVAAHLRRRGIEAKPTPHPDIPHRVRLRPAPRRSHPRVSVVVVSRGRSKTHDRCLSAVLGRTTYPKMQIISTACADADGEEQRDGVLRLDSGATFSPGRLGQLAASRASGDYLAFLSEDTEVIEPDWIEQLLLYAEMPGVGAVAPTLVRPDGRVDAAGAIIGSYDPAVPAMTGFAADGDGYYGSLSCAREVSAASMECLLVSAEGFRDAGGFQPAYSRQYADYDLCMKLRGRGLSTICAPAPRTITHRTEAVRRADFDVIDRGLYVDSWYGELAAGDPYYNRGFGRSAADYTPAAHGARAVASGVAA